jgi:hypothetical protein
VSSGGTYSTVMFVVSEAQAASSLRATLLKCPQHIGTRPSTYMVSHPSRECYKLCFFHGLPGTEVMPFVELHNLKYSANLILIGVIKTRTASVV